MIEHLKYQDEAKQLLSTGVRALIVLIALLAKPRTHQELAEFLYQCGFRENYSVDKLHMDINAIKVLGCDVSKALKSNNYKYKLLSNPFKIKLLPAELNFLKESYKALSKTCSPKTLLDYHFLFCKLAEIVESEDMKEALLGISILKDLDINIIKELVDNEEHNNIIKLIYSVNNKKEVEYDITLERLGLRSDKLYAFCFNHNFSKRMFLKVSRIKKIISKHFEKTSIIGLDTRVKFQLYNSHLYQLEPNEIVQEVQKDFLIISGRYYNDFIAVQRILSFGKDSIVLEPDNIKETILDKLIEMRGLYNG